MTFTARTLEVEGLANARDLGGLPLLGGGTTPSGVFLRSENLDRVTPRGWEQLSALGVRTVIDLRRPDEHPRNPQPRPTWLTTVELDLDGPLDGPFWLEHWDGGRGACSAGYYLPHLAAMPDRIGAVLHALAGVPDGAGGGVLFHCAGGRDRTGLVAMVLLSIAGVEADAIVEDYLETMRRAELIAAAHGTSNVEPLIAELLAERGTSAERAFRAALAGLDPDAVLSAAGLDRAARARLSSWRTTPPRGSRSPAPSSTRP